MEQNKTEPIEAWAYEIELVEADAGDAPPASAPQEKPAKEKTILWEKLKESKAFWTKLWDWVSTAFVAVVVCIAILAVGARIMGLQVFSVLSGSMEPTYHTGSLIYVKTIDYTELQPGDVITFMLNEKLTATHRIVEVVPDAEDPTTLWYWTKGDANEVMDGEPVHYRNVIGTPVFSVPYLGYISNYLQTPPGSYIALCAGAVAVLLVFLPDLIAKAILKEKRKQSLQQILEAN